MAGDRGLRLDGAIVWIVGVFLPDNQITNQDGETPIPPQSGYVVGEIVSFLGPNNNS